MDAEEESLRVARGPGLEGMTCVDGSVAAGMGTSIAQNGDC